MKKGIKKTKQKEISTGKDYAAEEKMLTESASDEVVQATATKPRPKSLDEIWGIQKKSKYTVLNEADYRAYLSRLNKVELQAECIKIGHPPRDARESMTNVLIKEFRAHQNRLATAQIQPRVLKETPETKKLLERGQNPLI